MIPTCADSVETKTLASSQAASNLADNRAALARTQPGVVTADSPADVEWVFGRDRSLTFRDAQGNWFTGCSLPRRAAIEMMRSLDVTGPVACFLAPSHAAQIRVALDRLRPEQAVIAIVPLADQLPLLLACDNFGLDIDQHRLWFAVGKEWAEHLGKLFAEQPGLCIPAQFIRLPVADDVTIETLIAPAQQAFADVSSARIAEIRTLRESYTPQSDRLCVVAPSQFRLWEDAGAALAEIFASQDVMRIDLDHPIEASALALAKRAHECRAIIAANIARSDLPNVVSDEIPWITWAPDTRMPPAQSAAPHDRLITAHRHLAMKCGWNSSQILEAAWPASMMPATTDPAESGSLALISNTHPLDPPDYLSEYSSHRVLWELINADLHNDPFALGDDIDAFLTRRVRKLDIATEALPSARLIADLILPAYQQSLARALIGAKIPLRLFGAGWDRIHEFAPHAAGPIRSREHLFETAASHAALVHIWPNTGPHAIDALDRPVLRRRGSHGTTFLSDARQLLTGRAVSSPITMPNLSAAMIRKLVP